MYPEALASDKRWIATHPSQSRNPYCLAVSASIYGLQGRNEEAEALIKELRETAQQRYVSGFFFAEAYVGLGQRDQAIIWLERAYEEHDEWMVFANSYPGLDRLRSEPRFQVLMRRMNFPYFREAAEVISASAGGPPDREKMMDVFRRHGMTVAASPLAPSST
jgi:tetratricopeptide (TPR) repeat protein